MQGAAGENEREGPTGAGERSALAFAWETIEALGADQSLSGILQSWALAVVKHLDANLARVWTMSGVGLQLQATAEANTLAGDAYTHMPVGAFVEEIAAECRPYATNDLLNDPHLLDPEWAKREHLKAFAGHPLTIRGKLVGVAAMVSKQPVSDTTMQALATSAAGLALTIRRKRVEAAGKEAIRELRAKNAELRAAGRRSQALIDLAPSGILVVDRAGAMTLVNSMAEKMFGYRQDELLGQPADMLLPPPLRGTGVFSGPEKRALPERAGLCGLRRDGSEFPVEIGLIPIEPGGDMRCSIVDITDRADTLRLQKAHAEVRAAGERSRQIVESVPNGIVVADQFGAITLVNAPAEKMFGFERGELIGQPVKMLLPAPMRAASLPASERDLTAVRKDGSEFPVEISLNPIPADGEMSVLWSIVDVTERKRAEARLHEAARLKSEFLANMSHEIRTPINVLVGMSGLLLETDLMPDQRDLAETIRNGAESLLVVINDSLDFSKMEAGKLEIDPADFEVDGVVEDVTSFFSQSASRKGLALTCLVEYDVPQHVYGDGGRLRQILTNLVGNAIKFTERGGISLRVAVAEPARATTLRFEVRDSGIGIPAEAQGRIFQAFTQADGSTTRRYGGTGLGLAIVKRLVELMHGTIGVESEPGRGSTFWFQIPYERAQEPKEFDRESSARMVDVRALVVAEDGARRLNITEQMESWRMKTESAGTAAEALVRIREAARSERPFGLVVLDYAIGAAEIIRSEAGMAAVPIVMMVAREDRKAAEKINGAAVTVYLTRPARKHHLHKAVAMALLPVEADGARKPARPAALRAGQRFLLVEDNADNQKLTVRLLRKYGYDCDIACNGSEALAMMSGCDYPLVLMDCQMPEMDGFQATAAIREREGKSRHTPIVAMTAHALEGDREKCLRAGMDDYVSKPVTEGLLVSAIERWAPSAIPPAPAPQIDIPEPAAEPAGDHSRFRVIAREGLEDLIPDYLANCTKSLADLADAVARQDLATARGIGHGMKGCGLGYGFAAITDIGRDIEFAATGNDAAAISEQILKLGEYLARVEVVYP